jgi:hypothetical protein
MMSVSGIDEIYSTTVAPTSKRILLGLYTAENGLV